MADVVASATEAPKKAFNFAKNNVLAFVVLAIVLILLLVAYQVRNPGKVEQNIAKLPVVGPWALGIKKAA